MSSAVHGEVAGRGEAALNRLLELNPHLGEAYALRAAIAEFLPGQPGRAQDLATAIALNPHMIAKYCLDPNAE
jgi:hypothetical protein